MSKNSHVTTVTEEQIIKLSEILKTSCWELTNAPHAHWKAKSSNCNIIAYNSGKLVVQGKGTEEFVLFILEPRITGIAQFGYEEELGLTKPDEIVDPILIPLPHAGIDESGKGDFFGHLTIACAFVDEEAGDKLLNMGVQDSKNIKSDKKIIKISLDIKKVLKNKFAIVAIGPEAYNKMYYNFSNLNKLLAWGHARALENLLEKVPNCKSVLADKFGNERLIKNALMEKGKKLKLVQQTKAERDIAVAAASILARAEFVRRMNMLEKQLDDIKLYKGCSAKVEEAAKKIVRKYGKNELTKYVKIHFKTYNKILGNM